MAAEVQKPRLLVLEDEPNVGSTLVERLEQEGYTVTWSKTCEDARLQIAQRHFDLALLDVGLPDGNGFEVAAAIRSRSPRTALVFLTAFGSAPDRVRGLELGAEDYVVKPFHLRELMLRIKNCLRRARVLSTGAVTIGRAVVKFDSFEASIDGETQTLTRKECALLRLLYERRGEVVSRDEILNQVWSEDEYPSSRTVDNFVLRLRRWVEIRSIRGVGYLLQ